MDQKDRDLEERHYNNGAIMKRIFLKISVALGLCAFTVPHAVFAQDYPVKPITVVVPFGPGGSHDLLSRGITGIMPEIIGQPMIVKLLPGGAGVKATGFVANAKPDGYTILFTHNGIDMVVPQTRAVPFNTQTDFVSIAKIDQSESIIITGANSGIESFDDFIATAKERPGDVNVGHSGVWGASYTDYQTIAAATGIKANLIPHKGGGPILQSTLTGLIDIGFASPAQAIPLIESGDIRALAVLGNERLSGHPTIEAIPSSLELGYPDLGFAVERIFLAPAGTPEDRLETLRTAFVELQENASYKRFMRSIGEQPQFMSGEDYDMKRPGEFERFGKIIESVTK